MTNDYESAPAAGGNDPAEQGGEVGMCIKLHKNSDGTYLVSQSEEPASDDGQPAQNLMEALMMAKDLLEGGGESQDDMDAAQRGYKSKAQPEMQAPSPEGLFGE